MSWKRSAKKVPQFWLHMNTYEPLFGCQPTWVFVAPFPSNRRFFKEIATIKHGFAWYWMILESSCKPRRDATTDENEKIKKRKRFKTRTRCTLVFQVFVAIERLTLSNLNWIDRDRGFNIQDCCFITFDLFRPDDENGSKWGQETAFIFGQIR